MAMINVVAAGGLRFPREDNAREYITGEPVAVANSAYYRRALRAGDLILVSPVSQPQTVARSVEPAPLAAETSEDVTAVVATAKAKKAKSDD